MSRSDRSNEPLQNPCKRWFEWSGKDGSLKWYDRETKENHFVDNPFRFLVLDQLNTVSGFSDELQTGFYANEVRRNADNLIVRTKKGIFKSGKWKEDLSAIQGARFTKSVYIGFFNENKVLTLGNIKFSGSALGGMSDAAIQNNEKAHGKDSTIELYSEALLNSVGWFNFVKATPDIGEVAIELVDKVADKKGSNEFFRPLFRSVKVSPATNEAAMNLDRELQSYLKLYFAQSGNEENAQAASASAGGSSYFDEREREMNDYNKDETTFPEHSGGEPSDDSDVPF